MYTPNVQSMQCSIYSVFYSVVFVFQTSRTALQEAIDNDHKEIVPLLIEATKKAKEKVRNNTEVYVVASIIIMG